MELIKISKNTEFDVIYDDGTAKRVHEGILLEAAGNQMIFHNGTSRKAVLFAAVESLYEVIALLGLMPEFEIYLNSGKGA